MSNENKQTKEELRDSLKDSHLVFCHEYIIDWNGSRAYQVAYPEATIEVCRASSSRLLTNVKVRSYIDLIKTDIEKECNISKISQIKKLQEIINSKVELKNNVVISEASSDRDKISALQEINKMLGFNAPDKLDLTSKGNEIKSSITAEDLIKATELLKDKY